MSWVWEHSRARGNARFVLLAIADCANDEGSNAYPSMAKLTQKTSLAERTVQTAISALVKLGELKVERNRGPHGTNRYRIISTPAESAPPQNLHPPKPNRRAKQAAQAKAADPAESAAPANPAPPQNPRLTPAESAPEPSVNRQLKNSSSKSSSTGKRGARIPDNFTVTPEMVAWHQENTPAVDGRRETAKFLDHWTAASGANAVKRDWTAAWRNWMRKAAEWAPGGARASPGSVRPSTTDQRVAAGIALLAEFTDPQEGATRALTG